MEYKSNKIISEPIKFLIKDFTQQIKYKRLDRPKIILMNKPFNLYLTEKQADTYIKTIEDELFERHIYYPFKEILKNQTENILKNIKGDVEFFDLGPGYPDKTLPLLQFLESSTTSLKYIPVDISKHFLEITFNFMKKYSFKIIPLNCLFEELPSILKRNEIFNSSSLKIFNMGFTFNNYPYNKIFNLFKKFLTHNSIGLIATETIDDDITKSLQPYLSEKAKKFNFLILENIGFSINDFDYFVNYKENRIEMGFEALKEIRLSNKIILSNKDKIITSISYRYPRKFFMRLIKKKFSYSEFFWSKNLNICLVKIKN